MAVESPTDVVRRVAVDAPDAFRPGCAGSAAWGAAVPVSHRVPPASKTAPWADGTARTMFRSDSYGEEGTR
jgi:hypothetical protein